MRFASYILTGAAACGIIGFIPAAQARHLRLFSAFPVLIY